MLCHLALSEYSFIIENPSDASDHGLYLEHSVKCYSMAMELATHDKLNTIKKRLANAYNEYGVYLMNAGSKNNGKVIFYKF
jgi:hypothetical protein